MQQKSVHHAPPPLFRNPALSGSSPEWLVVDGDVAVDSENEEGLETSQPSSPSKANKKASSAAPKRKSAGKSNTKKPEEVAEVIVQPKAKFRPKRKAAPRKVPVDSNAVQQKTVRLKKKNSGKQGGEEQTTVEVGDLSIPDTPRDNQSQQTTPRDTQPTPRGEAATKFANRAMEEMHGKSDNSEQVIAERDALQEVVKQFVRAACRGVQCIYIDLSSGGSASAQYKIDDSLTTMTVTLASGGSFECSLDKIKECTLYEEFGTQLPVLQRLTPEHQKRTILVECQGPEGAGDSQWLCLLEASSDMADRFVTCLEILRLYGVSQTSAQGNTPRAH